MKAIGILPCAGLGLRMRPLRYPKELLPVCFEKSEDGQTLIPRLSIDYSIDAFKVAGIKRCYAIVAEWKPEIMRYLGDGSTYDIDIGYLYNSKALGLADAIFTMYPWVSGEVTCLSMPDTQYAPCDAFCTLIQKLEEKDGDLVLGIFPTDEPECFAPVDMDADHRVISVVDKPRNSKLMNAWGIAVWRPSFWEFFKSVKGSIPEGGSISGVFHDAAQNGLKVYGVYFDEGTYNDVGRYDKFNLFQSVVM